MLIRAGGAEVVTVSNLPGPVYPDLADPYHGERPCCFSGDGRHVASGSEDGFLQVWDLTGAQVTSIILSHFHEQRHAAAAMEECRVPIQSFMDCSLFGLPCTIRRIVAKRIFNEILLAIVLLY